MNKLKFFALCAATFLAGCKSPTPVPAPATPNTIAIRNNACSLLYQLCDEEKDVSILRFIRREQVDIKDLTKTIAATAKAGEVQLDEFARRDPSFPVKDVQLPPGEVATRDAISKAKEKNLLTFKGRQFEVALLLSQVEALNYGSHLAKVAAEHDNNPERVRALNDMAAQMEGLYKRAFDLLLALPKPR
jgi:hypothetical protein